MWRSRIPAWDINTVNESSQFLPQSSKFLGNVMLTLGFQCKKASSLRSRVPGEVMRTSTKTVLGISFMTFLLSILASSAVVMVVILSTYSGGRRRSTATDTPALKVQFVTYTDKLELAECMSIRSAASQGMLIDILGLDSKVSSTELARRKQNKVYHMANYLKKVPQNTVVVFNDAADVLYVADRDTIDQKLQSLFFTGNFPRIVFAAERNFWPFYLDSQPRLPGAVNKLATYPNATSTSYRFLNSGNWAGTGNAARNLVKCWIRLLSTNAYLDDQHAAQELFMERRSDYTCGAHMALDSNCELFQTGHKSNLESEDKWHKEDEHGPYVDITTGRLFNMETQTSPAIVHFNGGKTSFSKVADFFWQTASKESFNQTWTLLIARFPKLDNCQRFFGA